MVPRRDPRAEQRKYPCPYPFAMTLENIRRVAEYWTGGDGEAARALPAPLFNQILGVVIAREQGREIEAEEHAREQERAAKVRGMR